jgi:hypothetical protein
MEGVVLVPEVLLELEVEVVEVLVELELLGVVVLLLISPVLALISRKDCKFEIVVLTCKKILSL